jgi:hypothetical protein
MKRTINQFMEEIKNVFQKYNKDIPLTMLVNSADLYIDTLKKELKR